MSEFSIFDFFFDNSRERRHQEYLERQTRREQRHQEYLERQALREQRHQEYLERQARREANRAAYFARITSNVQRFREQYDKILNDIRQQGLESFIQEDFRSICEKVQQLDQLLAIDDVEAARDLSFEIGQSIHGLIPRARRVKQQKDLNDSEIKRQARQDFIEQMRKNFELDTQVSQAFSRNRTLPLRVRFRLKDCAGGKFQGEPRNISATRGASGTYSQSRAAFFSKNHAQCEHGRAKNHAFSLVFFRGRCKIPIFLQKTIFRECFVVSQSI